jgi:medium-chain acyl-[acyl-carrier-protein] hydrolase
MSTSPWIKRANPHAQFRLFCFPYAGGGASIYHAWSRSLPAAIDVCAVQLPGRENRIGEPLFTSLPLLIDSLAHELAPFFDKPFAFFGHSMGAMISFELTRCLRSRRQPEPSQLFVSAFRAPQMPLSRDMLHNLSAAEFLRSVFRMGGTPPAVLLHKELVELMLPILRADFTIYETYTYTREEPLTCPITVFGGEQDTLVTVRELQEWREQTHSSFKLCMLPGNHFFLQGSQQQLLQIIASDLQKSF